MKLTDSRKRLLGAVLRQDRSLAERRLAEATRDLEQVEKALAEIAKTARRLESELKTAQVKGEVKAGRLETAALGLERKRARHGDVEARRRAVAEELKTMQARVEAAKEAVGRAHRALDALNRRGG